MIKMPFHLPGVIAALLAAALPLPALAQTPAGDAVAGAQKTQMCSGCHGIEGWRTAFPEVYQVPRIGGQNAPYIVKALQEMAPEQRSASAVIGNIDFLRRADKLIGAGLTYTDAVDTARGGNDRTGPPIMARLLKPSFNWLLVFVPVAAALRYAAPDRSLWIAWPRKAGGHDSDITENGIRDVVLPLGLVDVKVAALDDDWSGLKVVWRRERRK